MWLSQGDVWGLRGVSFTAPELWGEGWAGEAELMSTSLAEEWDLCEGHWGHRAGF